MKTAPGCILQGKYSEAQPLLERALAINEVARGMDSPVTIVARGSMGTLYKKQGFFDKAFPLFEEIFNTREGLYGPDHPWVANALIYRADLLSTQVRERLLRVLHDASARSFEELLCIFRCHYIDSFCILGFLRRLRGV